MSPLAWVAVGVLLAFVLAVAYVRVGGGDPLPPCSETSAPVDKCRRSGTEEPCQHVKR